MTSSAVPGEVLPTRDDLPTPGGLLAIALAATLARLNGFLCVRRAPVTARPMHHRAPGARDAPEPEDVMLDVMFPTRASGDRTAMLPRPGLCVTCQHGSHCALAAASRGPVLDCELFAIEAVQAAPHPEVDVAAPEPMRGLCTNCAEQRSCTLARSPGGVWHCEEYH